MSSGGSGLHAGAARPVARDRPPLGVRQHAGCATHVCFAQRAVRWSCRARPGATHVCFAQRAVRWSCRARPGVTHVCFAQRAVRWSCRARPGATHVCFAQRAVRWSCRARRPRDLPRLCAVDRPDVCETFGEELTTGAAQTEEGLPGGAARRPGIPARRRARASTGDAGRAAPVRPEHRPDDHAVLTRTKTGRAPELNAATWWRHDRLGAPSAPRASCCDRLTALPGSSAARSRGSRSRGGELAAAPRRRGGELRPGRRLPTRRGRAGARGDPQRGGV